MAIYTNSTASAQLKSYFETGDIPTTDNFIDLIDSFAIYDGTLPLISGSSTGTGSFGQLNVVGNVGSNLIPNVTNTYDLGSSTFDWKNLFVSGTIGVGTIASLSGSTQLNTSITVSSSLTPSANNIWKLGSSTNKWSIVFIGTGSIDVVSSSLIPEADDTYDLGSSTKKWKDLYVDGVAYIDNLNTGSMDVLVVNTDVSSSLIPDVDDAFDLGSSGKKWKDLYVDGTAYIDTLDLGGTYTNIDIVGISSSLELLNISGTVHPSQTNKFDLGKSTLKWKDLHVSGVAAMGTIAHTSGTVAANTTITVSSSLTPVLTNTFTLGTNALQYKEVFANSVSSSLITSSIAEIKTANITTLTSDTSTLTNASISNITGSPIISGNLVPFLTNTHSLGSTTSHWKEGHITTASIAHLQSEGTEGYVLVSGSFLPQNDDTWDLGASGNEWKDLYIDGTANLDTATIGNAAITSLTSNLLPSTDGTKNLGSKAKQFGTAFMVTASISGYVSSSLIPHLDDTYDLGSSGNEWKDLYIDGTANIDTLLADAASTNTFNTAISASAYLATFSTSGSDAGLVKSAIRFQNLPTNETDARLIGSGSLWKGVHSGSSAYLMVFKG